MMMRVLRFGTVLSILGSESFLKIREVIFWCMKPMRSDADERVNLEVAMWEKCVV